jgi:hypothetical protein
LNREPERSVREKPVTGLDRLIWPLSTLCVTLTGLGVPGVVIAALFLPAGTVHRGAGWVFAAAILSDLMSVYLDVTYLLRGRGRHGLWLFSASYYVVFAIFGISGAWWWRLVALAALLASHIACRWYLPRPVARKLGWRPEPPRQRR